VATTDEIAVLRIELQGIEPLIWRRVAVHTSISLMDTHGVIQGAMGWLNSHLWNFEVNNRKFGMRLPDDDDWNERIENAENTTLEMVLHGGQLRMEYVYDMGDFWEHLIIVERVTTPLPEVTYPQFLGGERRCPPEDCGGPFGYSEFLRKLFREEKNTREDALAWHGEPYDPDDIGEQKIVSALRRIATGRIGRSTSRRRKSR
jgi:hypothetical protein